MLSKTTKITFRFHKLETTILLIKIVISGPKTNLQLEVKTKL